MGGYVALAFAELYPENVKALVLLNSPPELIVRNEKKSPSSKAVKQSYIGFVSLAIANLFSENNRERLIEEIETHKKRH
jgi:pimeloyl-ACP methyl ester carboxylesterase